MTTLRKKKALARLPAPLAGLERLALNARWSWDCATRDLFAGMDGELWREIRENPVALLARIDVARLEDLSSDGDFLARIDERCADLDAYTADREGARFAYLSMEYALHESIPLYSGGLGVLSGDHLKAASDRGIPLVAVGLLYRKGYFTQRLDREGRQFERLPHLDPETTPVQLVCGDDGRELIVEVEIGDRAIGSRVWLLQVGKVDLYLLDTDVEENGDDDRRISWQLYIGDRRTRLEQEIVLGVGAVRLLEGALGILPETYHLNEGHCALSLIERLGRDAAQGGGIERAVERVRSRTVFTTHTPVAAGNEEFDADLVAEHFAAAAEEIGLPLGELLGLGAVDGRETGAFSLTVLALKLSRYSNAVSRLHGEVCREMWRDIWPELDLDRVPISHITNGVHGPTWMGRPVRALLSDRTAYSPTENDGDPVAWSGVGDIPAGALWEVHLAQKAILVEHLRRRVADEARRRGEDPGGGIESPDVLTVGFARRFATYKRGTLLLHDLDRLDAIVNDPERPLRLVFAGKAHPADEGGKDLIRRVFDVSREPRFAGRVVFVEDYDMELGRYLTGGVDLWLNNPVRPMEACGTSGMKAVLNGVLNCSIRDGWWDEVDEEGYGFSIVAGEGEDRDAADREALLGLLAGRVSPMYYDRGEDGVPAKWVEMMRRAMRDLAPRFSAHRMVEDYERLAYEI